MLVELKPYDWPEEVWAVVKIHGDKHHVIGYFNKLPDTSNSDCIQYSDEQWALMKQEGLDKLGITWQYILDTAEDCMCCWDVEENEGRIRDLWWYYHTDEDVEYVRNRFKDE